MRTQHLAKWNRYSHFWSVMTVRGAVSDDLNREIEQLLDREPWLDVEAAILGLGVVSLDDYRDYYRALNACTYLVVNGLLTHEQLEEALAMQATTGRLLGYVLTSELMYCSIEQFVAALSASDRVLSTACLPNAPHRVDELAVSAPIDRLRKPMCGVDSMAPSRAL